MSFSGQSQTTRGTSYYIVSECADGIKVFAIIIYIWGFGAEADGELAKKQYGKHGLVYESSSHFISSRILSLRFPTAT